MKFIGTTQKGAGRGKKIGFPTVNVKLATPEYEEGVFAVRGELDGKKFEGIAHFGPRPTFGDENLSVEIHIFNFSEEVPEKTDVEFETVGLRIRGVQSFASGKDLAQQIEKDIAQAKYLCRNNVEEVEKMAD